MSGKQLNLTIGGGANEERFFLRRNQIIKLQIHQVYINVNIYADNSSKLLKIFQEQLSYRVNSFNALNDTNFLTTKDYDKLYGPTKYINFNFCPSSLQLLKNSSALSHVVTQHHNIVIPLSTLAHLFLKTA